MKHENIYSEFYFQVCVFIALSKKVTPPKFGIVLSKFYFEYNPNLNTFLKNFVTSTENTCARISFLIRSQALGFRNSCEFLVKFSEQLGIAASEK